MDRGQGPCGCSAWTQSKLLERKHDAWGFPGIPYSTCTAVPLHRRAALRSHSSGVSTGRAPLPGDRALVPHGVSTHTCAYTCTHRRSAATQRFPGLSGPCFHGATAQLQSLCATPLPGSPRPGPAACVPPAPREPRRPPSARQARRRPEEAGRTPTAPRPRGRPAPPAPPTGRALRAERLRRVAAPSAPSPAAAPRAMCPRPGAPPSGRPRRL